MRVDALEYLYASFRAPRRMKASDTIRRSSVALNGQLFARMKWRAACE